MLPSGKRFHKYGKSHFFLGKHPINGHFGVITSINLSYFSGASRVVDHGYMIHAEILRKPLQNWCLEKSDLIELGSRPKKNGSPQFPPQETHQPAESLLVFHSGWIADESCQCLYDIFFNLPCWIMLNLFLHATRYVLRRGFSVDSPSLFLPTSAGQSHQHHLGTGASGDQNLGAWHFAWRKLRENGWEFAGEITFEKWSFEDVWVGKSWENTRNRIWKVLMAGRIIEL